MNFKSRQGVAALITVLSLGGLIFIISMASAILAFWANQNIKSISDSNKAFYAAQSGLQDSLIKLERNKDYTSTGFNLSINGTNDVLATVSFASNQATISSVSTLSQINKELQTVVDINAATGLITSTSTIEQTL
jgi:Tfp pilus assembly protein PilX